MVREIQEIRYKLVMILYFTEKNVTAWERSGTGRRSRRRMPLPTARQGLDEPGPAKASNPSPALSGTRFPR